MDESMPTVSVVIPAYNQSGYLRDAIQSVCAQTYRNFEIIVVDDGSTDDTPLIIPRLFSDVHYIRQQNMGLAGARNTGICAARGELIGLLDADDQWYPDFLESIIRLTEQFPKAAVYFSCTRCMDSLGKDLPQLLGIPLKSSADLYQTLLKTNFLIPSTVLMRKSTIKSEGLFDPNLRSCEDWDLWLRIAPKYDMIGTTKCLARYRIHTNSLSTNLTGMHNAVRAVFEKHFGPNDGKWEQWSALKRKAYAGVYRYLAWSSVVRNNDWQSCSEYLRQALHFDPSISVDIDLFWDLALGNQPFGYRGSSYQLNLTDNKKYVGLLLKQIFNSSTDQRIKSLERQTYGTAYFALGLVAYNTRQLSQSRFFLFKALLCRPELWNEKRVSGNLLKSLLGFRLLEILIWLKNKRIEDSG
jgi:glycosyltransferase involved in cell wall biosynthesis